MLNQPTEQEKRLVGALIKTWREVSAALKYFSSLQKDVEEMLLEGHKRTQKRTLGLHVSLAKTVQAVEKVSSASTNKNLAMEHVVAATRHDQRARSFLDVIIPMHAVEPSLTEETCHTLQEILQTFEELGDYWKDVRKTAGTAFEERVGALKRVRMTTRTAIEDWASSSAAHREYVKKCKGPIITFRSPQPNTALAASSRNGAPVQSRRRNKRANAKGNSNTSNTPPADPPSQKEWKVVLTGATPESTHETLVLPENGEEFRETLRQYYTWDPKADLTLNNLREILNEEPKNRIRWNRVSDGIYESWHSVRCGRKWRILVNIIDEENCVQLYAGHRKDVYRRKGMQIRKS